MRICIVQTENYPAISKNGQNPALTGSISPSVNRALDVAATAACWYGGLLPSSARHWSGFWLVKRCHRRLLLLCVWFISEDVAIPYHNDESIDQLTNPNQTLNKLSEALYFKFKRNKAV